jgi:hypothetical protein
VTENGEPVIERGLLTMSGTASEPFDMNVNLPQGHALPYGSWLFRGWMPYFFLGEPIVLGGVFLTKLRAPAIPLSVAGDGGAGALNVCLLS